MSEEHGFVLLKQQDIPELNSHARLLRHAKTGAELLSIENQDENKVFGIAFRTPPQDSTGVAHIMEHAVLCGSRKYPVKEPFVELVKGSLKTFVNAFTFPDKTCYPVASQNLQDFWNLVDVYLDAVFYPLIPPHAFQQDGWHYELETADAPLTFKGVVFNEMKGAYSSPDSVLARVSQQSLFPDNAYGVDSGGDPRRIPNLTYQQFKDFHTRYYHPSNARIFFYGDDDPAERLRRMDEYLRSFERLEIDSQVALQPRFDQPRRWVVPYDAGEESEGNKGMVTLNWMLDEVTDPETALALHVLDYLLVGIPASPLRKALIDSGLGEDLAGSGLEGELRQFFFSTGLKGIAVEDADRVERLILGTLEELAQQGIDPDMVGAAVNTVEFSLRENNTGSFPRGLLLMLRSLTTWLYGGDPLAPLAFERPMTAIRQQYEARQPYFEALIRRFLLGNPHRTLVILQPDPGCRQRLEAEEAERLAQARAGMSTQDVQGVIEDTRQLKLRQQTPDTPQALATIPVLKVSDLDRLNKIIPIERLNLAGVQALYHDLFTNGIAYLDLGFDLHSLPQGLLPYVSLFGRALLEMGTQKEDFVKLSQRIGRTTGGISPSVFTSTVRNSTRSTAWLFLRSKATLPQLGDLFAILEDVLLQPRLDNQERFRQMVLEEKAEQEASLAPAGHRLVNSRLRARFSEADWAAEQMGGISYLFFLRRLAERVEKDWPAVLADLEAMRSILVRGGGMLVNATLDRDGWQVFQPRLVEYLGRLPGSSSERVEWSFEKPAYPEGLAFPSQVNYVGKGANLYRLGYELDGSQAVILNYLRTTWLWERVRVQGGAYGGFCVFDHRSGVLTFLSYRDPNLAGTLENYDGAGRFLRRLDLDPDELAKSVIGAIGDMDAYQLPDAKGYTSALRYLTGDTDDFRQRLRQQVLETQVEHFHRFGEVLEQVTTAGEVVVLGSQQALEAANQQQPGWLDVKNIL